MATTTQISGVEAWNAAPERPWSRLFAKIFDIAFFMSVSKAFFYALFYVLSAEQALRVHSGTLAMDLSYEGAGYIIAAAIFWPMVEAVSATLFGTTPGKAMLGIRLIDMRGRNLRLWPSIKRSYGAFVLGLGLLLPLVPLATASWSYRRLKRTGENYWDRYAGACVRSRPVPRWRWAMLFLFLFFISLRLQVTQEADLLVHCCTW